MQVTPNFQLKRLQMRRFFLLYLIETNIYETRSISEMLERIVTFPKEVQKGWHG